MVWDPRTGRWTRPTLRQEPEVEWDNLRETGVPVTQQEPTHTDWKRWGATFATSHTFAAAAESTRLGGTQLLDARFPRPLTWMLAFLINQVSTDGAFDSTDFFADITYGCGSGQFQHSFAVGSLTNLVLGPKLVTFGPVPAETIFVVPRIVSVTGGVSFPRTSSYTFGCFLAPQFW